jgi:protein arginine N-methyltransferase 1
MYSVEDYGDMLADRVRMSAYERALRQSVKPGSVVLEIGSGPGIMAVLACQLGASCVYAIEPNPVIQLAREIAIANDCANKIEFIEDISTRVTVPILADVIVSDLRGAIPLLERHIPSIVDARRRFLAPGGSLIAREDRIWCAVVEVPERYGKLVNPWGSATLGQDLSPARRRVVNEIQKVRIVPNQLLTRPLLWARLEYSKVESPDVQGELSWTVERDGTGYGVAAWFEADLADGISFSTAPGEADTVYGNLFFPWLNPVPLVAGEQVRVNLQAKLLELEYFWRWTTEITSVKSPERISTHFDQSQIHSMLVSPSELQHRASDFVPHISAEGRIRRRALELMDGTASLEEIARRLAIEFPERFPIWHKALSFAGSVSKENCQT